MRYAPNIELLFTEHASPEARIRAAADHGFDAVELWSTSDKDLATLRGTAEAVGVEILSVLSEPFSNVVIPGSLDGFLEGVTASLDRAARLGATMIVVPTGVGFPGMNRARNHEVLVDALQQVAAIAARANVEVLVEPVNSAVDHPGVLLDRTRQGAEVVRGVAATNIGLLYDVYHSVTMDEDPVEVIHGIQDVMRHVQIADAPGRGEPGTGRIDFDAVYAALDEVGYGGAVGLELIPAGSTSEVLASLPRR